jgi:hypothetical protein
MGNTVFSGMSPLSPCVMIFFCVWVFSLVYPLRCMACCDECDGSHVTHYCCFPQLTIVFLSLLFNIFKHKVVHVLHHNSPSLEHCCLCLHGNCTFSGPCSLAQCHFSLILIVHPLSWEHHLHVIPTEHVEEELH